jgi:hypothetical protein
MKKLISLIVLFLVAIPTLGFAASYYGCANAAINANYTFCETPAGTGAVTADTALEGTHTLYANGYTITIPESLVMSTAKLSNKDDGGDMVDGGKFTVNTTGWTSTTTALTVTTLEVGATTDLISITGTGTVDPATGSIFTLTAGTCTAGSAANTYCVSDARTTNASKVSASFTTLTGGGNNSAYGWCGNSNSSAILTALSVTSAIGSGSAPAIYTNASGTVTQTGKCVGSATSFAIPGCRGNNSTTPLYIVGSLEWGTAGTGSGPPAAGNFVWQPVAPASGGGSYILTTGGTPVYVGIPSAGNAADVVAGKYFIQKTDGVPTVGTASSGGGVPYAY